MIIVIVCSIFLEGLAPDQGRWKNFNLGGKAMRKRLVVLSLCVLTVVFLGGMKGCSLIGVAPDTLNFTVQDVQNGNSQKVLVWSKLPLVKMHVQIECDDEWVEVNPVGLDSMGPWNREEVKVKINTSVLESSQGMLESSLKLKAKIALTNQEVSTSSSVNIKVNLSGAGQTGGTGGDGGGNGSGNS